MSPLAQQTLQKNMNNYENKNKSSSTTNLSYAGLIKKF